MSGRAEYGAEKKERQIAAGAGSVGGGIVVGVVMVMGWG